ncbi:probable LRR receptor-like serine/threonine-protein kinase At1g53440 [Pyrus x bretschneideri]|uniref:probable LRR receptor-like serine/threonine-protein kinase At1g53440 n=1 Tax=Pyrus x bretschneideri TaxID=225117 RepID=UPI0020301836|nr:probable LRR receptor-like serine/threonine-protein kinase At1g53440 [Pyrus x bretschneideri]
MSSSVIVVGLLMGLLALSCAQLLPLEEVKTLETISRKLHNPHWKNISQTSCQDGGVGFFKHFTAHIFSNVTCKCSFANNTCHVKIIKLKGLNLTGVIPEEFGDLTHLEEIDLTHNYISGSIPASLSRCPIRSLYLLGNRLSGSIPAGDFTLLRELVLEDNQFEGPLPQNLGRLTHLERLLLSANDFTGTIPESYGYLKNLIDFRIGGSQLSGKIPEFIGNWSKLQKLDLQGTSMEGPIPYTISSLKDLKELMISDLDGPSMPFPTLKYMKNIQIVILRNCSISGTIPNYLGKLTKLLILDLSFNKLTGEIPQTIERAHHLSFLCLSNNILTGEVPIGILQSKRDQDLSYNNFTGSPSVSCQHLTLNLVSSHSSLENSWCLKKGLPCSSKPKYHSIFINCGGRKTKFDGHTYEEDLSTLGPSSFFSSSQKWGSSSTGLYMHKPNANYIATNVLSLNITGPDFYQTARIAPVSLKYYALCMLKGRYKVRLYFSEIMFTNDQTFSSLGKRLFDISIQGILVQKDFNIMDEAGGVGKGIVKEFDNVTVLGSTLEIHLYWAGKGTTAIPYRGVYGPLISAISVTPNFDSPTESVSTIPHGRIGGCVAVAIILTVLVILWIKRCLVGLQKTLEDDLKGVELQTRKFTFTELKDATANFHQANKIGKGSFGTVYKGILADRTQIAVKQLSPESNQGEHEFFNEIEMLHVLQHPNLVYLYGYCIEENQLFLVYEYMENNSVYHALFEESQLDLDWATRRKICVGIAKGLAYLHDGSSLRVIHRDIKASNVLLDKHLNPKISDFGLAKLAEEDKTHISTNPVGTPGYIAPEYANLGHLTNKADVYSFGIVLLEIISGKKKSDKKGFYILHWAHDLKSKGNLMNLVDPRLGSEFNNEEMIATINVALHCCNSTSKFRPTMSEVMSMLEGEAAVQEFVLDPNPSSSNERDPIVNEVFQSVLRGGAGTLEGPSNDSDAALDDIHPVNPHPGHQDNKKGRKWQSY